MKFSKDMGQLIWGGALIVMGIAIMIMIPYRIAALEAETQSSSLLFGRFSMYLFSIILIGGGLKKLIFHFLNAGSKKSQKTE